MTHLRSPPVRSEKPFALLILFVLLKLVGEAVNIMCQVNPKYEKVVVIEYRKKVLYLHLLKALYGYVQSALLWYDSFILSAACCSICTPDS